MVLRFELSNAYPPESLMFSHILSILASWFTSPKLVPVAASSGRLLTSERVGVEPTGPIRRLLFGQQLEQWAGRLEPSVSLVECRARVVDIQCTTAGAKTFVLRPNLLWQGHRAGQYIMVSPSIDGVRTGRPYSICSGAVPGERVWGAGRTIAITVGRVAGGRVSNWMHDHLRVGDVLPISQAMGEAMDDRLTSDRRLYVAAGTGMTPIRAALMDAARTGQLTDSVLVQFAPTRHQAPFCEEMQRLAATHAGFRYLLVETRRGGAESGTHEGLTVAWLTAAVPDVEERQTFVCGPSRLSEAAGSIWGELQLRGALKFERFDAPAIRTADVGESVNVQVTLSRSQRTVNLTGSGPLLTQLEAAGLKPASGCRRGICHQCACQMASGVIEDLQTGERRTVQGERVKLCVSRALGDVEIQL